MINYFNREEGSAWTELSFDLYEVTGCFKGSEEGGRRDVQDLSRSQGKGNLLKAIRGVDPPSGPAHWFSWKFDLCLPSETEWQALYIQVSWNKEWILLSAWASPDRNIWGLWNYPMMPWLRNSVCIGSSLLMGGRIRWVESYLLRVSSFYWPRLRLIKKRAQGLPWWFSG